MKGLIRLGGCAGRSESSECTSFDLAYEILVLIYRGSYISAHVFIEFIKQVGESVKMRDLQSILSLFCHLFNKFNNTRAGVLDSIYHMTLTLLSNLISAVKHYNFVIMYATLLCMS